MVIPILASMDIGYCLIQNGAASAFNWRRTEVLRWASPIAFLLCPDFKDLFQEPLRVRRSLEIQLVEEAIRTLPPGPSENKD